MKGTFSILVSIAISLITIAASAQISVSPMNTASLSDAPFNYKGKRVMMADRVDDANSKNIYLFTKPAKGTLPDTLFVQKFTKTDEVWKLAASKEIVHNGAVSIWQARKAFTDPDQDKQVDTYFIYSLHNADASKQLSVHLLLIHKNEFYTISGYPDQTKIGYGRTEFSSNFNNLNQKLKDEVMRYWNGLDKD